MKGCFVAVVCLGMSGCNASTEGASDFSETPLIADALSDRGVFEVELYTAPDQPPTFGTVAIQLRVIERRTKAPLDGLTITTVPIMPSMGHGTSVVPNAEGKGDGYYVFSTINLFMAGRWDFVTDIRGSSRDTITLAIDVR